MLLALAVAFSAGALRQYAYWGANGPGPAFLPFWLGLVMAVLATMLLVGALRTKDPGASWLPSGEGVRRLAFVLGATIAYVAMLNLLGMVVATVLFLIVLMRVLDRCGWPLTLAVALATAGSIYFVFGRWLKVPLPTGVLGV